MSRVTLLEVSEAAESELDVWVCRSWCSTGTECCPPGRTPWVPPMLQSVLDCSASIVHAKRAVVSGFLQEGRQLRG